MAKEESLWHPTVTKTEEGSQTTEEPKKTLQCHYSTTGRSVTGVVVQFEDELCPNITRRSLPVKSHAGWYAAVPVSVRRRGDDGTLPQQRHLKWMAWA